MAYNYKRKQACCIICGAPLPKGQRILCSEECKNEYYYTPRIVACSQCGAITTVTGTKTLCPHCKTMNSRSYQSRKESNDRKTLECRSVYKEMEAEACRKEEEKPKPVFTLDAYEQDVRYRRENGLPYISYGNWRVEKDKLLQQVKK